ncbi:hypothetical protein HY251_07785 [bacterium]|nr:hypothetical protein [bacterium]
MVVRDVSWMAEADRKAYLDPDVLEIQPMQAVIALGGPGDDARIFRNETRGDDGRWYNQGLDVHVGTTLLPLHAETVHNRDGQEAGVEARPVHFFWNGSGRRELTAVVLFRARRAVHTEYVAVASNTVEVDIADPLPRDRQAFEEVLRAGLFDPQASCDVAAFKAFFECYGASVYAPFVALDLGARPMRPPDREALVPGGRRAFLRHVLATDPDFPYRALLLGNLVAEALATDGAAPLGKAEEAAADIRELELHHPGSFGLAKAKLAAGAYLRSLEEQERKIDAAALAEARLYLTPLLTETPASAQEKLPK